eukprot:PhM_4_TR8328/c0_g3_i4/m.21768
MPLPLLTAAWLLPLAGDGALLADLPEHAEIALLPLAADLLRRLAIGGKNGHGFYCRVPATMLTLTAALLVRLSAALLVSLSAALLVSTSAALLLLRLSAALLLLKMSAA